MVINLSSSRIFLTIIFVAMLAGCAPNNISIRFVYSRLDDNIERNFNRYAEFNHEQKSWIRGQSRKYQLWLRENQLPVYADFMDGLAGELESGVIATQHNISHYSGILRKLSKTSFEQLPLSHSVDMLEGLTDVQVSQIESYLQKQNEDQLKKIREQEKLDSNTERIDRMDKSLSRIGISLTREQRKIIDRGMNRYVGSREDRIRAWGKWESNFIALLEDRNQTDFRSKMTSHIATYQSHMNLQFPEQHLENTKITIDTVVELVNSLTVDQRDTLVKNLRKTSAVFREMANSKQTTIL